MKRILVVGAGFSGATTARELADSGFCEVDIIDRRDHIGGNSYDEIHQQTGCRYHKYGPHIFHTNDSRIFDYLSSFTQWVPYQHKVEAFVEGVGDVPMPVNLTTMNRVFDKTLANEAEVIEFLNQLRIPIDNPENAHEFLLSTFGETITELFFARYTEKMWGLTLKQMPVSVVARIPIRKDSNPHYFNDQYQFMPLDGYSKLIQNMLEHEQIKIDLNVEFSKAMENGYDHVFNSMPIDLYFDQCFGELPYRSIKFDHRIGEKFDHQVPTVNFTDRKIYTRKTNWNLYPGCGGGEKSLITYEIPCDYKENNYERYYPVKTVDGGPQRIYKRYAEKAKELENVTFVGRCGQYIYYDMHQVVANSRMLAERYLYSVR